jgi:hypothetical protein
MLRGTVRQPSSSSRTSPGLEQGGIPPGPGFRARELWTKVGSNQYPGKIRDDKLVLTRVGLNSLNMGNSPPSYRQFGDDDQPARVSARRSTWSATKFTWMRSKKRGPRPEQWRCDTVHRSSADHLRPNKGSMLPPGGFFYRKPSIIWMNLEQSYLLHAEGHTAATVGHQLSCTLPPCATPVGKGTLGGGIGLPQDGKKTTHRL